MRTQVPKLNRKAEYDRLDEARLDAFLVQVGTLSE